MILYLIRHGQTDAHLENRRQSPATPLGELGHRQAEVVAEKMNLKKIDHLYSSDWPRAYQTAEAISAKLGLPIKIHPHVHEMKRSPLLDNIPEDSETNQKYFAQVQANHGNFDWKFNGEGESLNEIISRATKVIKFLEDQRPDDTIAVVTHGTFMRILVTLIFLGPNFDKETFLNVFLCLDVYNTGVTSFEYDSDKQRWRLNCFNDHGHLENE